MVEGRPGMAAIGDDGKENFDLTILAADIDRALPVFARPLFLRITKNIEITGKQLFYIRDVIWSRHKRPHS